MKNKLILKKTALKHKKNISKTFGCRVFEPTECCLCSEVDKFMVVGQFENKDA